MNLNENSLILKTQIPLQIKYEFIFFFFIHKTYFFGLSKVLHHQTTNVNMLMKMNHSNHTGERGRGVIEGLCNTAKCKQNSVVHSKQHYSQNKVHYKGNSIIMMAIFSPITCSTYKVLMHKAKINIYFLLSSYALSQGQLKQQATFTDFALQNTYTQTIVY